MSARDSGSAETPRVQPKTKSEANETGTFGAFVRKTVARRADDEARIEPVEQLPDDAIEVGAIVDAYGLKGWVKVVPHANAGHGGDAMLSAKCWWLVKGGERKSARCLQSKVHSDTVVARLAGCDDRDAALLLRGHTIHIARADFPKLADEDEFYWVDLIGLDVENEAGVALGRVADMIDNGAHSIMRIEYPATSKEGKPVHAERLIPFVGVYVKTVDRAAGKIVVEWDADY